MSFATFALQARRPLYWDPAGTLSTSGSGRAGSWNASTVAWYNGTSDIGWVTGDDAYFGGAAGSTVTLTGLISADNLIFNTTGYSIASSTGTNTLTLTGGTINVATGNGHDQFVALWKCRPG